jgi:hypothetical protein
MPELPDGMMQKERQPVSEFHEEEYLYRRVPHEYWDEGADDPSIELDAIALPDMSVGRSLFAHPEWLRLVEDAEDWAVVGFMVKHIPPEQWKDGVQYVFRAVHAPDRRNYPHSEVQAFEEATKLHVDGKKILLPHRTHLDWRERLIRKVRVFLRAYQPRETRQHSPTSHVPERPIVP